jgi:hypothetical protein
MLAAASVFIMFYIVIIKAVVLFIYGPQIIVLYKWWIEAIIALYIFIFLTFLFLLPAARSRKKAIIYCVTVPFFCNVAHSTTMGLIYFAARGRIPSHRNIIGLIEEITIVLLGLAQYVMFFVWFVSVPLILVYGAYFCMSKYFNKNTLEKGGVPLIGKIDMKPLQYKRLFLIMLLVYIAYILLYFTMLRVQWGGHSEWKWQSHYELSYFGSRICLLSFVSILWLVPSNIGKIKRLIAYCFAIPFFWNVAIFAIHALMIIVCTWNTESFTSSIFTANFYLHNYIESYAWFISFPLLLVCAVCHYFTKSAIGTKDAIEVHGN